MVYTNKTISLSVNCFEKCNFSYLYISYNRSLNKPYLNFYLLVRVLYMNEKVIGYLELSYAF